MLTNNTTIKFKLESGDFKSLQTLMLLNNVKRSAFFNYEIAPPNYKGDTYKAFYLYDVEKDVTFNKE